MFRVSTLNFLVLLIVVALVPAWSQGTGVVEMAPSGTNFDELPYASWLNAGGNRLNISMEVGYVLITIQVTILPGFVQFCPVLSGFDGG